MHLSFAYTFPFWLSPPSIHRADPSEALKDARDSLLRTVADTWRILKALRVSSYCEPDGEARTRAYEAIETLNEVLRSRANTARYTAGHLEGKYIAA